MATILIVDDSPGIRAFLVALLSNSGHRLLEARDGTGYQFVQTRGLVVIDSPIGLVACLPMGMAQVSSVVITAERPVRRAVPEIMPWVDEHRAAAGVQPLTYVADGKASVL